MDHETREKTAFVTPTMRGQFTKMSFGLKNAPVVFQSFMNRILGKLKNRVAFYCLNDILIQVKSFEEMCNRLREILKSLSQANLTCCLSKCYFAQFRIEFLYSEISAGELRPGHAKICAFKDFKVPLKVHKVRRFLGLSVVIRRFVHNYAIVERRLTDLLSKNCEFKWTDKIRIQTLLSC